MTLKMYSEKELQIVGIAAGKGGVGKSTVTVQLARSLKNQGFKVGILDADLYGPSIRKMLPEDRLPLQNKEKIFPALTDGIKTLSLAFFKEEDKGAIVRAPIANKLIKQFLQRTDWGGIDILLIDFPPGTGDIQLTLAQEAKLSGALMVTTPQQVAILDVKKAAHLFTEVNVPLLGTVENMSYYLNPNGEKIRLFGEGGGRTLARELGTPFLGEVPVDPAISAAGDEGKEIQGESKKIFDNLAIQLREELKKNREGTLLPSLRQVSPYEFAISWGDGVEKLYRLSDIQKACPCALCSDKKNSAYVDPDVKAEKIDGVGRYAIRIFFTSGCSQGIYDYDYLYNLV